MTDEERDKALKKLRSLVKRRNEVTSEIEELEKSKKVLGAKITEALEALEERDTTTLFPKLNGFRLDRPEKMVVNEERLGGWLKEHAPKVHKLVFKRVVQFDRKAFEDAVASGDVPDVDEVLSNDEFVRFEKMTPRLMPSKAKKPSA